MSDNAPDKPWLAEPTDAAFEAAGYQCRLRRKSKLHPWCGYVGVANGHPLWGLERRGHSDTLVPFVARRMFGRNDELTMPVFDVLSMEFGDNDATPALALAVHGGITYDGGRLDESWPDGLWWFGFDCGHCRDLVPLLGEFDARLLEEFVRLGAVWRTAEYAESETRYLAEQLAEVALTAAGK